MNASVVGMVLIWGVWIAAGGYIGGLRGRPITGALLGLVAGPLGVIGAACLADTAELAAYRQVLLERELSERRPALLARIDRQEQARRRRAAEEVLAQAAAEEKLQELRAARRAKNPAAHLDDHE